MSANPPSHLRQQISAQLVQILRVYVILITALVVVATVLASYLFQRADLQRQQALVATTLGTTLSNLGFELESLAHSSVLWTGLTDSFGREAYMEPLLAGLNRSGFRQFMVLDYRGRVFVAADRTQAEAVAAGEVAAAAVKGARDAAGLQISASGQPEIVLAYAIESPVSEQPVGFIVVKFNMAELAPRFGLAQDVRLSLGIDGQPLMPPPSQGLALVAHADLPVRAGDMDLTVHVHLEQPVYRTVVASLIGLIAALALAFWVILRVNAWALRFAASTTRRLDRLLADCQRVLAGQDLEEVADGPHDELSEVTQALNALLRRQKRFTDELRTTSLVFSTAAEGILVTDPKGRIVDVNPALTRMIGYEREELLGRTAGEFYRTASGADKSREMSQALAQTGHWSGETNFIGRDGRILPASVSISQIVTENGRGSAGNVAVITDISRLKAAEDQLRGLAYRDALTSLPNFRHISEQVNVLLAAARGTARRFAVLFMDLDHFKAVNDNHGHDAGDALIRAVAAHLSEALPPGHLLCRRSGDEFIAVIELAGQEPRPKSLQRLLAGLTPIQVATDWGSLSVTATIGVSRFPEDAGDWHGLQICADVAMNSAKQSRRGSVAWYDGALGERLQRRRLIQGRLQQAIEARAIEVHYQPEVDLRTGRVIGFEALARWTDPELGVIRPAEFIPVAEEAFLIDTFTLYVAEIVLRDKARLQARFPGAHVAFNVAPQMFRNTRMLDFLLAHNMRAEGTLDGLEIELTESQISTTEMSLQQQLQSLTGIGIKLVIDDFGTGYSSLSRLTQFPISRLKIDRSFVSGLSLSRQDRIAQLIVDLAKGLGFEVTAEGIETAEQLDILRRMGCHRGQGWLFGRAMPLQEALALDNLLLPSVAADAAAP